LRWEISDSWLLDGRLGIAQDRDDNRGGQCVPYPDAELYATLTDPAYLAAYAGPGGVATPYTGPGPFDTVEGVARWGGTGGGARPGGHIDSVYVGAALDYVNGCLTDSSMGPWVTSQDMPNTFSNVDNNMLTLNATWSAPGALGAFENATIQIQGGWRNTGYWYMQDRDFSPFIIDHVGNYGGNSDNQGVNRRTDEFEVIFNGDLNDRLHLTAGVYWFDDVAQTGDNGCLGTWSNAYDPAADTINGVFDDTIVCQPEGGTLMPRLPGTGLVGLTNTYGRTTGESTAIYAHVTYALNDRWDMAVGARAMQDDRTQENIELDLAAALDDCVADANSFCSPTILLNRSTVIDNGIYVNAQGDDSKVTPSLSFTRRLDAGDMLDSGNVYFALSQGYLTGAFNDEIPVNQIPSAEGKALAQSLISYDPEEVTNYEVGFKGTLADGRVRLATALFYMDYTDKQEAIDISNPDGLLGPNEALEYTDNVGEVGVSGIELELRTSPWDGGFVSVDLGYLDYDYKEFSFVDIGQDPPQVVEGLPPLGNRTPEWTITASVEHAFQLANGASLTPQLGVYMQDDYEWLGSFPSGGTLAENDSSTLCHQDSYAKWRARLTYEPAGGAWQAALFGYNITDEEILLGCGGTRTGTYRWYHQAPAQWGAEFTMRFGNN
jgi:outer membrane receptor protein involved in Fe transport